MIPFLAVVWIGFDRGHIEFDFIFRGLPIVGLVYGMILITVKEYAEQ